MEFFGIFKKNKGKKEEKKTLEIGTTTISYGAEIKNGELVLDSDLIIEGNYSGKISTTRGLIIGKTGKVTGSVEASSIILGGVISGEVECDTIDVLDGAILRGKIITEKFRIGDGGIFEGIIKKK